MKKIIILIALIFSVAVTNAQYNKWAVEAEVGTHRLDLPIGSSEGLDNGAHFGLAGRYNFNPKVGLGLVAGFDNVSVEFPNSTVNLDYLRVNAEVYINIFKILDLYPKNVTMLVHGGPGFSWITADNGYDDRVENISGGITGLYRLNNRVALKLDYTSTGNISERGTITNLPAQSSGVSSTTHNLSIGAVVYFGKKKENKDERLSHADWYVAPNEVLVPINNVVNYYQEDYITNVSVDGVCDCNSFSNQYIFFDDDEDVIKNTELNALYKIFEVLRKNDDTSLVIRGWASPTSSTDDYNHKLSDRRSIMVHDKLVDMGVNEDRITYKSFGKDRDKGKLAVHDVARRVELIIVKNN